MKNLRKGFLVPALIAIIAMLAIGGGVYVYKNKKAATSLPVETTETENVSIDTSIVEKPTAKNTSQIVPVKVGFSSMNESVHVLLNGVTVLGQKYLYFRSNQGVSVMINALDPEAGNAGDSCGDSVVASLEIANPKIDSKHLTFQGYQTVDVDLVRVVSHDKPQRVCADFSTIAGPDSLVVGQTGTWKMATASGFRYSVIWSDGTPFAYDGGESGIPAVSEFTTSTKFTHKFSVAGDYHPQFFSKTSDGIVSVQILDVKVLAR